MTTPTNTPDSESANGASPIDAAVLARLATEMFAELGPDSSPGAEQLAREAASADGTVTDAGIPPSSAGGAAQRVVSPQLDPWPDPAKRPGAAPTLSSMAGGPTSSNAIDAGRSSSPFYFLGDVSAPLASLESFSPSLDHVMPTGALAPQSAFLAPQTPGETTSGVEYYFLERSARGGTSTGMPSTAGTPFDVNAVRRDFPALNERVNGHQLVWLDNAATTQKPQAVIDRLSYFYSHENSNIHRAAHELAARATDAYEKARTTVARFLGASSSDEIVFVRGATEAINLVAQSWGRQYVGEGDEIVISHLEHHANIVPWQQLATERGAKLRVIPVDDSGQILLDGYRALLNDRTKIVSVAHVSNALGTIVPVHEVVELAHRAGARVLVDGAQAVSHLRVDMQALGADFYVFSGHKVFGPTGIGVLYGTSEVLSAMPPWQGGGNMIKDVTFERTSYHNPPGRFEAGTGNIADAVGLGVALDYLERLGLEGVSRYEHDLLVYATEGMQTVPGLCMIGTAADKASVLSFVLDGHTTEDVGTALNREGIAVRAGHHCAQPILRRFGVETTVRPSLALYNTHLEVDLLVAALHRIAAGGDGRH